MGRKNKLIIFILGIFLFLMSLSPNLTTADALNEPTNYDVYLKSADFLAWEWIIKTVWKASEYNLYEGISRIEMLKIISKISKEELPQNCNSNFWDILSTHWWCKYSSWALEKKYISNNKFYRPNDDVSKVEALKMIFKVKNISVEKTSDWREWYVKKAFELGYSDLFLDYDQKATRWFVFDIIYKSLNNIELSKIDFEKQKVVLNFDENLNKNNIVSNLKIYPEVEFSANWIDNQNLEIVLQDLINKDVEFLVNTLDEETAKEVISKKFKITWSPTLDFVSPKWEITDVNQNIVVKFSKPIVELTNIDNQKSCPIKITPNIPWECHFITTSSFLFKPEKWFAYGAKYDVSIPSWIETHLWEKTLNWIQFQIYTPKFELINQYLPKNIDDKLVFNFNDEINLEDFKNNFRLTWYDNSNLEIKYLKSNSQDLKSGIEIFPKENNWWYDEKFEYTIFKNLNSKRWNIWLNKDLTWKFVTYDFLKNYKVVKMISQDEDDRYNLQNFVYSSWDKIVPKDNQILLLNFDKEVKLDKKLFEINHDFELNYPTYFEYKDGKYNVLTDKKSIVISVKSKNITWLKLKVLTSKISNSKDKVLSFFVKTSNSIDSFKNINYEISCLTTTQPLLLNDINYKNFKFNNYWNVNYIYQINDYDKYSKCSYKKDFYTYEISTNLNPNSDYILNISKNLLDKDLYNLDKDYEFKFSTSNALNKDKSINFIWWNNIVLYPKYLENKTFSILTTNLDKVFVEVCSGDLDITNTDLIGNKECKSKVLDVNNLWFKPNISVFWLDEIVWKNSFQVYKMSVSKLKEDKTDYELKSYFNISTKTYIFWDHFAFLTWGKSNILWVKNFLETEQISDIDSIWLYKYENWLLWYSNKFQKNLKFEKLKDWNYKITDKFNWSLLINLKSWEKIFLDSVWNGYQNWTIKNYITTSKPIYKPWETLQVSWISYEKSINWLKISNKKLQVYIRDSNYRNIFEKTIDVNDLWVFDFEYKISEDAKLGDYNVYIWNNNVNFKIENYIKPDFELNLDVNSDKIVSPNKAIFTINWKYFAWLELSNAKINYTLSSTKNTFSPKWFDQYTFGEDNFFDYFKWYYYNNSYKVEKTWTSYLNSKWFLNLEFDLDYTENKNYKLEVLMFDPITNKQISKTVSLESYQTSEMIWLKTDKYFYNVWDTANLEMIWVNLDNKMVKNSKFKLNIYKIDYKKVFGGNHTITEENKILSKDLVTQENGKVSLKNLFEKSWEYKIEILWNKWFKTIKNIYVGSWDILNPIFRDNSLILSLDKQEYNIWDIAKLNISSQKNNLKAIVVFSRLWEVIEYKEINLTDYSSDIEFEVKNSFLPWINIKVFSYDLVKNLDKYNEYKKLKLEINELTQKIIKEKIEIIRPYLYSDLYLQNEYEDVDLLKLNDLKRKEIELLNQILPNYYTKDIDLKTNFKTVTLDSKVSLDKEIYNPRDDSKIIVNLKDYLWKEVDWNLNISIIDKSLLSLYNNREDLIKSVYENNNNYLNFNSNIFNLIKSIDFKSDVFEVSGDEIDLSDIYWAWDVMSKSVTNSLWFELKATSDFDLMESDMVESSPIVSQDEGNIDENQVIIRNNFKDLVYYNALVEVKDWKAQIDISTLPDNLTTWSIVWFTHTDDLKLWTFVKDFEVKTDVWILPILPKTLTVWDEINLGFNILNNTNNDLKTNFEIITSNLEIKSTTKTITLNKKSSTLVEFKAKVLDMPEWWNLDNYYSNIKLLLKSWKITDWFEDKIKINYPSTKEYVYTLGDTNNLSFEEKLDFSKVKDYWNVSVNISAWATILTNLDTKLKEVIKYPYYDLSSKLSTLEQIDLLKDIYKNIWKINSYNEIKVYDEYNKKSYTLDELRAEIIKEIPDYLTNKNLFSYYKDCDYSRFGYCGSFSLTKKFLLLNKQIPWIDNKKVYDAYILELQKNIKDFNFTNINDFLVPWIYKDLNFVNNNFKPDLKNISNNEKLDYINIYNNLWVTNTYSEKFYNELKNAVLIEAKTSFLPTNSYFDNWVWVNSWFLKLALENKEDDFFTKNIVRYLLNEFFKDNYYADKTDILNGILSYILHTDELSNLDLEFSWYFNWKEIISWKFDEKNMFESLNKNYLLSQLTSDFSNNQIWFETNGKNKLYYDIWVWYYLRSKEIESRDLWIQIERNYYDYDDFNNSYTKKCESFSWFNYCFEQKLKNPEIINKTKKWNKVIWEITITLDKPRQNLIINDFIPSWFEIVNSNFDTTSNNDKNISKNNGYWYNLAEYRYDGVYLYSQNLRPWTYTFRYVMQNINSWIFNLRPAFSQLIDDKQIWWRTKGWEFIVE